MSRRSLTAVTLGLMLGLGLLAAPGRAEPSAADKAAARKLVGQAKRFIQQKKHAQAVDAFEKAYQRWPRKELQFNIALVHLEMGNKVKAYEHLGRYWRVSSPDERSRLPAPLLRLRNELGTLRVRASDPALGIRVGGTLRGTGSAEVVLEPGIHQVEILSGDEVVQKKTLRVTGGAEVLWEAEPPRPGGGQEVKPPPGTDTPKAKKKLPMVYFLSAAGLAVATAVVLVGTGVKTIQLGEDYDANPTRALQKEGRTYRAVTNVMVGVSAAAAVGAAVLAFFTRFSLKEQPSAMKVQPTVMPGGGALSFELSY